MKTYAAPVMNTIDTLYTLARNDLLIKGSQGRVDKLLWEHSRLVARTARRLAASPELARHHPKPPLVVAIALYHDSGYALTSAESSEFLGEALNRPGDDRHRELSASQVARRLSSVFDPSDLERARQAVRTVGTRSCESLEARIVSDADNLTQMGLGSLWPAIRQSALSGQAMEDFLRSWREKKRYHYWKSRMDTFFFDVTRRLARRRQEEYAAFLERLNREIEGGDLRDELPPLEDTFDPPTNLDPPTEA